MSLTNKEASLHKIQELNIELIEVCNNLDTLLNTLGDMSATLEPRDNYRRKFFENLLSIRNREQIAHPMQHTNNRQEQIIDSSYIFGVLWKLKLHKHLVPSERLEQINLEYRQLVEETLLAIICNSTQLEATKTELFNYIRNNLDLFNWLDSNPNYKLEDSDAEHEQISALYYLIKYKVVEENISRYQQEIVAINNNIVQENITLQTAINREQEKESQPERDISEVKQNLSSLF
jgi:hypothetical protein